MLHLQKASSSEHDFSALSPKELYAYVKKPDAHLRYQALIALFTGRGSQACFYQENFISACLNEHANHPEVPFAFANTTREKRNWQTLLLVALEDRQASSTHRILCLLLINELFPSEKKLDTKALASNIYCDFQNTIPTLDHTLYLKAFASQFSLQQIEDMLKTREKWANPFINHQRKVVEERYVLGPLLPRLPADRLMSYYRSLPHFENWFPQHQRYGNRFAAIAPYLNDEQVANEVKALNGQVDGLASYVLSSLACRLTTEQINLIFPQVIRKIQTHDGIERENIHQILIAFAPYLQASQQSQARKEIYYKLQTPVSGRRSFFELARFDEFFRAMVTPISAEAFQLAEKEYESEMEKQGALTDDVEDDEYYERSDINSMTDNERDFVKWRSLIDQKICASQLHVDHEEGSSMIKALAPSLTPIQIAIFLDGLVWNLQLPDQKIRESAASALVELSHYAPLILLEEIIPKVKELFQDDNAAIRTAACYFFADYTIAVMKKPGLTQQTPEYIDLISQEMFKKKPDDTTLDLINGLTPYVSDDTRDRFTKIVRSFLSDQTSELSQKAWEIGLMMVKYLSDAQAKEMIAPMENKSRLGHQILSLHRNIVRQMQDLAPEIPAPAPTSEPITNVMRQVRRFCTIV